MDNPPRAYCMYFRRTQFVACLVIGPRIHFTHAKTARSLTSWRYTAKWCRSRQECVIVRTRTRFLHGILTGINLLQDLCPVRKSFAVGSKVNDLAFRVKSSALHATKASWRIPRGKLRSLVNRPFSKRAAKARAI